ncbi:MULTISPECIES: hypothetical protein [Butyricimonas]|uniref:hypothetical protein n=1 Tax=Butyricimonas TaxID=574697 RepID=UPI0011DD036C|nr:MULTISPECIES: hypothetical protein [Butyricimonas]
MKRILFVFVVCCMTSACTHKGEIGLILLQNKIDSLENCVRVLSIEKDSLSKIASRWEYGRDSYLYANDYPGGNSMSWRWEVSLSQLKFEEDVFDKRLVEISKESEHYKYHDGCVSSLRNNYTLPEHSRFFVVDTDFEVDRFNYFMSVVMVNTIADIVRRKATELVWKEKDISRVEASYLINDCVGLLYKKMYSTYNGDYKKATEERIKIFNYYMDVEDLW